MFVRIHWSVVLAAQPDKRHKPAVSKRASARRSDSAGIVTRKLLRTIGLYRPACAMVIVGDEHDNRSLGIRFSQIGSGFQFAAPADTTLRTLKVYVGAFAAAGKLEASLSDNSASAHTGSFTNQLDGESRAFSISYAAHDRCHGLSKV